MIKRKKKRKIPKKEKQPPWKKIARRCGHCGEPLFSVFESVYGHGMICFSCKEYERAMPNYIQACKAVNEAVRKGTRDLNERPERL